MLGAIGFFILTLIVGLYAYTCHTHYKFVPVREKRLFVATYGLLSLAALIWTTTFFVAESTVPILVFTSEVALVVATGCMLGIILDIAKPVVLILLTLLGASLVTVRAFFVPSTAYVADDLLIFDLSQIEALIIGLIFLIAWLPATIKIVYLALRSPNLLPFRNLVSFLFISVVLMTGFFLTARRPIMIIVSFVSIILLFAILTGFNIVLRGIDKAHEKMKVQHG